MLGLRARSPSRSAPSTVTDVAPNVLEKLERWALLGALTAEEYAQLSMFGKLRLEGSEMHKMSFALGGAEGISTSRATESCRCSESGISRTSESGSCRCSTSML